MSNNFIAVFYVPYPTKESAEAVANQLLNDKLIACANLLASESHYLWNGKKEVESEIVAIFKTLNHKKELVIKYIEENHPYDTPFIGCFKMEVNSKYLEWMQSILET